MVPQHARFHGFIVAALLAALLAAIGAGVHAQSATVSRAAPAFDAASVKRNITGDTNGSFGVRPGGVLVVVNNSLRNIVRNTYGVQNYQIVGGPEWFDTDRFDITAKAPGDAPPDQLLLMMRALLADRFMLRAHMDRRETPVYALSMARPDKRLGPTIRRSAVDCLAQVAAAVAAAREGRPPAAPGAGTPRCGTRSLPGTMTAVGVTMADLARNLSNPAGRAIVDKTGLTGAWDLELSYAPDSPGAAPPVAVDAPSLFTALQEQLGLKLEAQTAPIEVLVIDGADRPQDN